MNIDANPSARRDGFKTSAAIAITTLLVFGAVAGVLVGPAKSAFAATITSSSTQFFGPALEKFLITDSSKTNACDTITVHVKAARGSTSLFEQDVTLANIGTSGQFELFVTTSNPPMKPANPTYGYNSYNCLGSTAPFILRINNAPVLSNSHEIGFVLGAANPNLKDGDSLIVTYSGQAITVNFAKATVSASTDRPSSGVGNGGKVVVKITDTNAVLDPTGTDVINTNTKSTSPPVTDSPLTATGGILNLTGSRFVEEGQNVGIFDLPINVVSGAQASPNPTNGATLSSVTFPGSVSFQIQGMQVYNQTITFPNGTSFASPTASGATAPFNGIVTNPGVTSTTSVVAQNTDGTVTTGTVSLATGIPVIINDGDQNFDTQAKDFLPPASVEITMDGLNAARGTPGNEWNNTGANAAVFQETGFNTGIFQPTLVDQAISVKLTSPGTSAINQSGVFLDPATIAGNNNIYVVYHDPAAVPNGIKAFQSVVLVNHVVGSISTTTSTVALNGKFPLTITDPDINTNKDTIVSFTVTFNSAGSDTENANQCWNTVQGCLTLKVGGNGLTFTNANPLSLTFIETGVNTGVFTASNVDMGVITAVAAANNHAVTDGTQIEFKYHDHDENPVQTSTTVIAVGKPPIQISVDRGTVPNPNDGLGAVKFTISVTDSALNTNPTSIQTQNLGAVFPSALTATVTEKDGSTMVPGSITGLTSGPNILISQPYTETAAGSGVFTNQYVVGPGVGNSLGQLDNAKIKFTYTSGAGTSASVSVTMRSYDGVLAASSSVVTVGTNITVTVSDPDLTRDNTVINQATITVLTKDDAINTQGNAGVLTFSDMKETGLGTGVFTKNLQIGKDVRVTDLAANLFATTVAIHYNDAAASDLTQNVDRELDLTVATTTGNVTVTPSVVGPGTTAYIYVNDKDLVQNPAGTDIVGQCPAGACQEYLRITSDATGANVLSSGIEGQETAPGSGIFKTKLTFSPATGTTTSGIFAGSSAASPSQEITATALPGDTVSVRYTDQKDASGAKATIATTFKVQSFDPVFSIDKTNVGAGDAFTITVTDPGAVKDSTAVDTITLRAYSTTDPVGITVSALETGPGTGVFTASIPTTTGVSAGSVSVHTGDTLTIKYNSKYPADYATRVHQLADPSKDFFYNVQIGGSSISSGAISPSTPTTVNLQNQQISSITSGTQVVLTSKLVNNQPSAQPYAAIVEVRDSNDITVSLQWQTGTLPQGGNSGIGVSWTPDQPGTYHVRIFVLTDIPNPQLLSPTVTSDVVVT